ncbi:helix-turn-helix domain-containing protein [Bradyrhizobium sp. 1]|nr:helix-turn-helix domain-containing protein [Bradyrhizobium sp. 1]
MSEVIPLIHDASIPDHGPLLVSRDQAREMLGDISVTQLRRLLKAGEIKPVFLNASPRPQRSGGKLYFRVSDLNKLVEKFARRRR